jgi:hypothetical protein
MEHALARQTRLALQAAAELLDDARAGVFFVSLAPIGDPQLVAAAIAQVLAVKEVADRALVEQLDDATFAAAWAAGQALTLEQAIARIASTFRCDSFMIIGAI